ncbi:MAG: hypothetical protein V1804_01730 [Patescibacteria group bacterium]
MDEDEARKQDEIVRKVLRAEGKYNRSTEFWKREENVQRKAIELFGAYDYGNGIKRVS